MNRAIKSSKWGSPENIKTVYSKLKNVILFIVRGPENTRKLMLSSISILVALSKCALWLSTTSVPNYSYFWTNFIRFKKKLSFCHTFWFSNPYIFATQRRRPFIIQTMNSVKSNNLDLKYQRITPSDWKDITFLLFFQWIILGLLDWLVDWFESVPKEFDLDRCLSTHARTT